MLVKLTTGLILIGMSSLFIFCQSFKIIPDLYELVVCNHAGNLGHNCAISKVPAMNIITRCQCRDFSFELQKAGFSILFKKNSVIIVI